MHLETALAQVLFKNILAVTGEAGINVDGDQLVVDRRTTSQLLEDVQQGVRVLAPGYGDGDPVALFNQLENADSLTGELIDFATLGIIV